MKVTNTIRFEEEKKNLIDNVVNTLEGSVAKLNL